jgi:hypothetical protein
VVCTISFAAKFTFNNEWLSRLEYEKEEWKDRFDELKIGYKHYISNNYFIYKTDKDLKNIEVDCVGALGMLYCLWYCLYRIFMLIRKCNITSWKIMNRPLKYVNRHSVCFSYDIVRRNRQDDFLPICWNKHKFELIFIIGKEITSNNYQIWYMFYGYNVTIPEAVEILCVKYGLYCFLNISDANWLKWNNKFLNFSFRVKYASMDVCHIMSNYFLLHLLKTCYHNYNPARSPFHELFVKGMFQIANKVETMSNIQHLL